MRPPGWFRLVRGSAFAVVCVAISQFGHDLMAVRPVPLWAGWAALVALGGLGYCLADRQRSVWWILLAVEAAQACLHVWFTWCTPADRGFVSASMRMPRRGGGMHAAAHGGAAMSQGAGMSLGMFGVHVLAGLLAAAWLYVGEQALWRALRVIAGFLVDRTLCVLVLLARSGVPIGSRGLVRVVVGFGEDEVAPAAVVLRHVLVRRGPPRTGGSLAFA
jgi:hypothetical protein